MMSRRAFASFVALATVTSIASPVWAQATKTSLLKVVTIKDEIIIGLSDAELKALGGNDAGAVAQALTQKGTLTVWQYGVKRGPNNEPQQAPTARIGLIANTSLRVEPYTTPYAILPHD